jgi:hypothetical protein
MSERFDLLFEPLRRQQPPAPFAPPAAVRRRGRQRSLRQALAVTVAVLAAGGAGVGWAAARTTATPDRPPVATKPPTPTPTPTPSPSPSGAKGLGTASPAPDGHPGPLQPADLGPGTWQAMQDLESFDGPDRWYWANLCPAYRSGDYASLKHMVTVTTVGYRSGDRYVHEHVHRYEAGWGPRALDDVRALVGRCTGPTTTPKADGGPLPGHFTVVDRGFAGDDALLVREENWVYGPGDQPTKAPPRLVAVVRVGDRLATVLLSPDATANTARTLAAKAAARLSGS